MTLSRHGLLIGTLVMAVVAVIVGSRPHLPSASQHMFTISKSHVLGGPRLHPRSKIVALDCATADTTIYVVYRVATNTSDVAPRDQDGLWVRRLTRAGASVGLPLRLTDRLVYSVRVIAYNDSIFVVYATASGIELFASHLGGSDWRSRTLLDGALGLVSGLAWIQKPFPSRPSLLYAVTRQDPLVSEADTVDAVHYGLYEVSDPLLAPSSRQVVSAPRAFGTQLEPTATGAGVFWASTEILGRSTSVQGIGFHSMVTRTYFCSGVGIVRDAKDEVLSAPTGAAGIATNGDIAGLLVANGLIYTRKTWPANLRLQKNRSVVAPDWLGRSQSIEAAPLDGGIMLVWIDGRNQVYPGKTLGAAALLLELKPWFNTDIYAGVLSGEGRSLALNHVQRLTQGTPVVRHERILKSDTGWLIIWVGKDTVSSDRPDNIFVATLQTS